MRTRSLIETGDVLLLEQVTARGNLRGGKQVSFWYGAREKLGKMHLRRFSRMEFGEQDISIDALKLTKKKKGLAEKTSETEAGNGSSRGIATHSLASSASGTSEEWDEDDDYDTELSEYRGLVLDLTYRPINVVCWRRALCLEFLEKAVVLEYYDQVINSPRRAFPIPAVLRITDYVHAPKRSKVKLTLNRKNIFLRDRFRCQYCSAHDNLTVDHVMPASRGGGWTWQNLVTACSECNVKKGDKTLEAANMQLIKPPREPNALDSRDVPSTYATYRTLSSSNKMPNKWLDYLPERPPQI